jgi:hypothetical protein
MHVVQQKLTLSERREHPICVRTFQTPGRHTFEAIEDACLVALRLQTP